jgi:hypothetical protein
VGIQGPPAAHKAGYDTRCKTKITVDYRNSALIRVVTKARKYDSKRDSMLRLPVTALIGGKLTKIDIQGLGIGSDTASRVLTPHQAEGLEVPALIDTGAAVGVVQSGLVEAINAHVFEIAVPVGIKGVTGPPQAAALVAVMVLDFYGYMVDNANPLMIKQCLDEHNLDKGRQRYLSVVVALVISDKIGEALLLGNNIGHRVNWTVQNSGYILLNWNSKLMIKAVSIEAQRQLMEEYNRVVDRRRQEKPRADTSTSGAAANSAEIKKNQGVPTPRAPAQVPIKVAKKEDEVSEAPPVKPRRSVHF